MERLRWPILTVLLAAFIAGLAFLLWEQRSPPGPLVIVLPTTAPLSTASPTPTTAAGLVNINTASLAELDTLPGIGPTLAQAIIAYREANGPFPTPAELMNVPRIGPATYEDLKDLVTVR